MGMSTSIYGIIPPDEEFQKMLKIYKMCKEANVDLPSQVGEYFDWTGEPDERGIKINLSGFDGIKQLGHTGGYDVELASLPKNLKVIRFENSW